MEKATMVARIDEDLGRIPEVRRACLAIVEYLSVNQEVLDRVTFGMLSKIAGTPEVTGVLPAVQYLSGSRLHLFDPRFEFIDVDRGSADEVPLDAVARARSEQKFYHPRTGEPVENFEEWLMMFFVLSEEARSLREHRR